MYDNSNENNKVSTTGRTNNVESRSVDYNPVYVPPAHAKDGSRPST